MPAVAVDNVVADLDRHDVRCVFSESPMLQWNLMFTSRERIAARWLLAKDRWQPYVERVDRAFLAGQPCALLLNVPDQESIAQLRAHFGDASKQLTIFEDRYALLYDPPRRFIVDRFMKDGGWD